MEAFVIKLKDKTVMMLWLVFLWWDQKFLMFVKHILLYMFPQQYHMRWQYGLGMCLVQAQMPMFFYRCTVLMAKQSHTICETRQTTLSRACVISLRYKMQVTCKKSGEYPLCWKQVRATKWALLIKIRFGWVNLLQIEIFVFIDKVQFCTSYILTVIVKYDSYVPLCKFITIFNFFEVN